MSVPLGVFAFPATAEDRPQHSRPKSSKQNKDRPSTADTQSTAGRSLDSSRSGKKPKPEKKPATQLSSRSWVTAFTRERKPSLPASDTSSLAPRAASISTFGSSPHDSFDLSIALSSAKSKSSSRPKHVPIVIPSEYSYVPSESEPSSGSFTFSTPSSVSPTSSHAPTLPSVEACPPSTRTAPRHVPIEITYRPEWAIPNYKDRNSPSPREPLLEFPALELAPISPFTMSATPESSRANTMDSNASRPTSGQLYPPSQNGSRSNISAHSSQVSLVGMRSEYESASEAESTQGDDGPGQHTPSQSVSSANPQTAPASSSSAGLSGLVCNVHRTTGREPHPLVGATTTVLGDKLYVFGGRRLSRTKPQLTANLYELDLIRRHWTKLESTGDIPPPRYFHSVCALGDTKLVCYGGMSPAPPPEAASDAQPEVIVMSDIHIYDVPSQKWTKVNTPDAPQGRYAHCASILPSSAVFASRDAPMSAIHHNPEGENPNEGTLGVDLDGTGGAEMIVVGGQDSANHYIEQISVFNLRSLKWTGTTGMGRSCGAYRSVVTPLTTMSATQIGAGPHAQGDMDEDDEEPTTIGSGSPMLIYSNYNFLDVKLELQVRLTDGTLIEKPMQTVVSPPGLRFPNGGIIDNHFVVSGTFLTSSKQEYALWALDLRTLTWSRIDVGGSIFSQGSWNRGVLWSRRNAFVILGNRKRSLVDDYNNRRINFSNICVVELEAFGLYENPRVAEPTSAYVSASAIPSVLPQRVPQSKDDAAFGRLLSAAAEDIGQLALGVRELADMDFLAIDGTRVPVNSRLISRRWGPHFITLLRESLMAAENGADTATLRATAAGHPSRNSSITITPSLSSATSGATTLTNNSNLTDTSLPDTRNAPATSRPRLLYLPHTAPTLHALLHYLYTSTLPSPPHPLATPQIFCSLLQLARPYKIDGLQEATIERLHQCLDGRNAAAIFNAAAMGAGGGDSVHFAANARSIHQSDIPVRTASLAGLEGLLNGDQTANPRSLSSLRIDTDMANGRSVRNTLRPGPRAAEDTDEEPMSASSTASMSESEYSTRSNKDVQDVWNGALSSVVGLQKRGLRGLMEGRRMREKGRDGFGEGRVGLGIAAN
ncbi:hypothetical protein CKM354_000249200 [Cercospora kikuchii]|uniref:Protein ral2 n=1 Tax=Cercospora kikuchii TaxID=84275 RepID=A0A9P3CAC6_9PEZI|nr:uncharacterized protein CKM354_000249200 [Cercospora kikuchii]GIZ39101.1 hypothetical protein CKM354_000249200 [Cercospora kikuchii]